MVARSIFGSVKRTPQSKEERAREAEAFTETLTALGGCSDRLLMNVLSEADEEIGAMSETEKRDSYRIVSEAVEGNWDWPLKRFAAEVWGASTPDASERLTPRSQGVETGRRAAHG